MAAAYLFLAAYFALAELGSKVMPPATPTVVTTVVTDPASTPAPAQPGAQSD